MRVFACKPAVAAGLWVLAAEDTPAGIAVLSGIHVPQQPAAVCLLTANIVLKQSFLAAAFRTSADRYYKITHDFYMADRSTVMNTVD